MTTNEVCVTVCLGNVWQHVQKIHAPNWFPTVSDWFRLVSHHLFWGLCFKHRESWVIFGGICDEGPPVLDVLIFTFWIYGSCGSWQANFRKSWVWAASPPKLSYPKQNFQISGESHGLSDFSRMIWVSAIPLCPADLWPWWKMLKHVGKYYPPRGLRKETEQIEHLHSPNRPHQVATELGPAPGNRQLPRRPGLQGSDSFAPGSTCALDSPWPTIPTVFICCLSVFCFYLFLSVFICV